MPLTGTVKLVVIPKLTKVGAFHTPEYSPQFSHEWAILNGVGASMADQMYTSPAAGLTLAQSANANLDLNGALFDLFGAAFALLKMKAFGFINRATSPDLLTVGRGATNGVIWLSAVSAGVQVPAGGGFLWFAPGLTAIPVVAATGDLINVLAPATVGTYTYDVIVIGASA